MSWKLYYRSLIHIRYLAEMSAANSFYGSARPAASMSTVVASSSSPVVVQGSDRIARLKEKIDGMQVTIEKEKVGQVERINARLGSFDERLRETVETRNAAIGAIASDVLSDSKSRSRFAKSSSTWQTTPPSVI